MNRRSDEDGEAFRAKEESGYRPPARGRPGPEPPIVRIEIVVVDGPDGRQLRATQLAAIRRALRWLTRQPNP